MKYYMKSKVFKLKEDFWIKNQYEEDTFFVDNQSLTFGLQFDIQKNNQVLYFVKETILTFLSNYEIFENDKVVATVNQKLTFLKTKVEVNSKYGELEIEGSIFEYNYKIYQGSKVVAQIEKEMFAFSDNYTVDIDFEDEAFILALVVIIDNIRDKRRSAAN